MKTVMDREDWMRDHPDIAEIYAEFCDTEKKLGELIEMLEGSDDKG